MNTLLTKFLISKTVSVKDIRFGHDLHLEPDHIYGHDRNTFKIIDELGGVPLTNCSAFSKLKLFQDHYSPPPDLETAALHKQQRSLAIQGATLSKAGEGVGHQVAIEKFISNWDLAIGVDSHTCSIGALGALGLRQPPTEVAKAVKGGFFRFDVPKSVRIELSGKFNENVYAKDLMLFLAKKGNRRFSDSVLEFGGSGLRSLSISERIVLANLSKDIGARTALCETDSLTMKYLEERGRQPNNCLLKTSPDAYLDVVEIDLKKISPYLSLPGSIHNAVAYDENNTSENVDVVTVGSCTNGRLEDFEVFARTIGEENFAPHTRVVLTPASSEVMQQLITSGLYQDFIQRGATINPPGCGPCMGLHQGVLSDNEICVATGSKNNAGRMGSVHAKVYLASPATAGRVAVIGRV